MQYITINCTSTSIIRDGEGSPGNTFHYILYNTLRYIALKCFTLQPPQWSGMVEAVLPILFITLLYNTLHHIVPKCYTLQPPQWSGVAGAALPSNLGPNRSAQHWKRSQQQFVCLSHALSMVYILLYFISFACLLHALFNLYIVQPFIIH